MVSSPSEIYKNIIKKNVYHRSDDVEKNSFNRISVLKFFFSPKILICYLVSVQRTLIDLNVEIEVE